MKALVKKYAKEGLWMDEVEKPQIENPNDVLIKIKKNAICGTDIHIYKWDGWAQANVPVPLVTGHEYVGIVEEVGSDVKGFKPGDRVTSEGHLVCGICKNCRTGKPHFCPQTRGIGYHVTGVFAEYFKVTAENVIKIPDDVSDDIAAILDPLGNATHTALAWDLVGEDILITGAGCIGSMATAIARYAGARSVVVTDIHDGHLERAKKMGATHTVNVKKENLKDVMKELGIEDGFPIGFEMSGSPHGFNQMVDVMRMGGYISLLGIPPGETPVNWGKIIFKALTLKGIYGREMYRTWYKMIAMVQGGLPIEKIISHHFKIDDFQKGFDVMMSGESGRVILEWE